MANKDQNEYSDILQLINSIDPFYQEEFPSIFKYINSILVDTEKLSRIRSIINTSDYWQFDIALLCLIDNCDEDIASLDIYPHLLREQLAKICYSASVFNIVQVIETLLILQNRYNCFRWLRYLFEISIYIRTGPAAISYLSTLCEVHSMNQDDFLIELKFLWIEKFLPELSHHCDGETMRKHIHHKKHFLQCNVQLVQSFIDSISVPYESVALIQLFDYFTCDKNILSLEKLESFLAKNIGKPVETCLNQLYASICFQYIFRKIIYIPSTLSVNIKYFIERMQSSWTLDDTCELVSLVQNKEDLSYLISILTTIIDYGLIFDRTIFNFNRNLSELSPTVHSYAIRISLSNEVKTFQLDDLITTIIAKTYPENIIEERTKQQQELYKQYRYLSTAYDYFSGMDKDVLKDQLACIQNIDFYHRIAFIMCVSDIIFKTPMRMVQKLAILLAINPLNRSAQIFQLETGEGKTRLISIIAVFKALEQIQVDVITSSKELAKIHVEQLKEFYEFFNLKIGCNADLSAQNHVYGQRRKKRNLAAKFMKLGFFKPIYECDVVYGSVDDFQAHILQDEFDGTGLRCERRCDFALVDEADSVMIDDREKMTRLASPVPSVSYLLQLTALIWSYTLDLPKIVKQKDGKWYRYYEDENGNRDTALLEKSIIDFA